MKTTTEPQHAERRVLVMAPTRRDATTAEALLTSATIPVQICPTFDALIAEMERGVAAILIPEEAVSTAPSARLSAAIARQPAWSDLPVLVLSRPGANSAASGEAVRTLGNVTLLERPVQVATLVSAVRTALRARERQIQIRGYLSAQARSEESLRLADQRKDEFLATLGHELRNPLAPLVTGVQLLKRSSLDDPRMAGVMAVMERQLQHLVRLVDDLLEVSRITRGLVEIDRAPLDLVAVVRAAIDTSRPALDAAAHELVVDLPAEPIPVAGDAVRLNQVFSNLLTNAAKYTNKGGRVWLTVRRDGASVRVSVRDNGIGIPPPHLGSVFEMFMQVDRSNRRAQGGLGIGLTLVRTLVELHGGRVRAYSDGSGAGSEFVVELPVAAVSLPIAEPAHGLLPLPPRRVLIVDDNRDAAETLGSLLASLGVTVAVVGSGQEALGILAAFAPDTVLMDIGMPEMDGYAVARCIRTMPAFRHVLLIALTGWGQGQDIQRSRAAGFDHHLVKPPDVEKLSALLKAGGTQTARPPGPPLTSTQVVKNGHGGT